MNTNKISKVRIIGGTWRGRKIEFPVVEGLRPTPDRIRETVFNWLAPNLANANCLDLFAGSGVLGFEALSRGAKSVSLVDSSQQVVEYLEKSKQLLKANTAQIIGATFSGKLILSRAPFDIVFLDPPYFKNTIKEACAWLKNKNYLAAKALIFIEAESALQPLPVPEEWSLLKSKQTPTIHYALWQLNA